MNDETHAGCVALIGLTLVIITLIVSITIYNLTVKKYYTENGYVQQPTTQETVGPVIWTKPSNITE